MLSTLQDNLIRKAKPSTTKRIAHLVEKYLSPVSYGDPNLSIQKLNDETQIFFGLAQPPIVGERSSMQYYAFRLIILIYCRKNSPHKLFGFDDEEIEHYCDHLNLLNHLSFSDINMEEDKTNKPLKNIFHYLGFSLDFSDKKLAALII